MTEPRVGYLVDVPPRSPQLIRLDPPLVKAEAAFVAAFTGRGGLRRLWPGQPSQISPWSPGPDGDSLELDPVAAAVDPETVGGWLRFLVREFLAPNSAEALDAALSEGLRGGHLLNGTVQVDRREVRVDDNRITEKYLPPELDGIVIDFESGRVQCAER